MLLPSTAGKLLDRVLYLQEQCMQSRQMRLQAYSVWRSYLYAGSRDPSSPAILNKMGPHADRLHSYLFSPAECRFLAEFGGRADKAWKRREGELGRLLTREFHVGQVDLAVGSAVFWSLVYGAAFVKLGVKTALESTPEADTSWVRSLWKRGRRQPTRGWLPDEKRQVFAAFDPYVVMPSAMGVFNEAVNGLDRQEVICHRTPITHYELARRLVNTPRAREIMERVKQEQSTRTDDDDQSFMHQVIIGGINPLATSGSPTAQQSRVDVFMTTMQPALSQEVTRQLSWLNELWIVDDERGDYTTIQYIEPDILIEGDQIRRNLFIPGHHPFTLIQANDQEGQFWGRSEFSDLWRLQDSIADRLADIIRIGKLQAQPPHAMMGFTGNVEEIKRAFRSPNGLLVSDMPQGKIEKLAPDLPTDAYQNLQELERKFDEVAGFQPVLIGQGEQGVRAGAHAQSLARSASARIRDRALKIERQAAECGRLCFDVLAAKDPTGYGEETYLLADAPSDLGISVDSHSSSPAFTEDQKNLAFALAKAGAITPEGLLDLVHPPMVDQLKVMLSEKQAAEQKLVAEHPELLTRGKRR